VKEFAEWLSVTGPSVFIKTHQAWMIPSIQTLHIVGIGIILGSVFMLNLRIFGLAAGDLTMRQTQQRFGPWIAGALWLLGLSGLLLIVAEPVRELITFSFWAKMALVLIGGLAVFGFGRMLRKHEEIWGDTLVQRPGIKFAALATFVLWLAVIVLGRLIAYDHVWGPLSPAARY